MTPVGRRNSSRRRPRNSSPKFCWLNGKRPNALKKRHFWSPLRATSRPKFPSSSAYLMRVSRQLLRTMMIRKFRAPCVRIPLIGRGGGGRISQSHFQLLSRQHQKSPQPYAARLTFPQNFQHVDGARIPQGHQRFDARAHLSETSLLQTSLEHVAHQRQCSRVVLTDGAEERQRSGAHGRLIPSRDELIT